jgi:hypothetical protein
MVASVFPADETEVPVWVLAGILAQESRSYYNEDASRIIYVDKRRGADGELGPYQMMHIAWRQIREPGERFEDLATDMMYAETCAIRYLLWLYNNSARRSWAHAIQYYNRGPGKLSYRYYVNVKAKARKAGYEVP